MGGEGKGRGEEWTGRGEQLKKNDPPSSDGWLRACNSGLKAVNLVFFVLQYFEYTMTKPERRAEVLLEAWSFALAR